MPQLKALSVADRSEANQRWGVAAKGPATGAVNGIDYLLTWNYKPIANVTVRAKIERSS